jgi:hypothetical protein
VSSRKPSASDRILRSSPASQPASGRAVSGKVRVQSVRFTIDLSPADHDALADWTHQERIKKADAIRALIRLLVGDPDTAAKVRAQIAAIAES